MAAATPDRFAPLSSPTSSPVASRSNSPPCSDASQRSRRASRLQSDIPTSSQCITSRLDTYPSTWTYTDLPSQRLATCGLPHTKPEEETGFCHACDMEVSIQRMMTLGEWSNDELLACHKEDCILADTIHNMINNVADIYTYHIPPKLNRCRLKIGMLTTQILLSL
ncbi:hypothetical protein GQ44DRAFT_96456 [Phaeosphaeriaceae sp. PMI808]|nr:hypothetical protein GQ44DRAFT_96456 [Phaeosphaeriaceae sp. PMI808]